MAFEVSEGHRLLHYTSLLL